MIVFSKQWFKKYNKQLCWLANSFIGDFVFKISKMGHDKKRYGKITEMHPNAITHKQRLLYNFEKKKTEQEYTTQFFSRNEYALRLQKVFYPIWLLFHGWDMFIANPFKPAWNLGFDTLTAYPVVGANSPCDGRSAYAEDPSWTTVRNAANGTYASATDVTATPYTRYTGSNYIITRAFALFDTSSLGASATISSVVYSIAANGSAVNDPESVDLDIVSSSPASNSNIVLADYNQVGSTVFASMALSSWTATDGTYNDFTLDANGISNVDKTGISKFAERTSQDTDNVAPTGWNLVTHYLADNGTGKPKLVVTYTATAAEKDNSIFFGCNF